jgi:hypothetical protein
MRRFVLAVLMLLLTTGLWGQAPAPAPSDSAQLRQEIDQLKKTIAAMEERLAAQEKAAQPKAVQQNLVSTEANKDVASVADLQSTVKDLDERVRNNERSRLLDRLAWTGDYRFEANMLRGTMPAYYNGMTLQNYLVKTMWMMTPASQGGPTFSQAQGQQFSQMMQSLQNMTPAQLQMMPKDQVQGFAAQYAQLVQGVVGNNYGQYQGFTNNLNFAAIKGFYNSFTPQMQQVFMGLLTNAPNVYQAQQAANVDALFTNRLRLGFKAKVADNINFDARLSMYKVFGDSTGVQVFNGQPNSMNIDGTTATVPTGDMLRVERAFFDWHDIGGSKLYLSIGRRPSTQGPPMNFREDEVRGGTPSGALIDYQFDGITLGYHLGEKTALRACWGQGFSAGFGNGLQTAADHIKGVQFFGGNVDAYNTEKTLVQVTVARAWNVTDGFPGLMASTTNFLTGDTLSAPVVMRYEPSANLGAINLYGLNLQKTIGQLDMFVSGNMDSMRPNGLTGPFGGLGTNPFDTPVDHNGTMVYVGLRYKIPQDDGRTKVGFEFNHGSKYWFNFAQAEDDIFMPKTATRGEAYETYVTHRINDHFIFRASYQRLNFRWSGSGWNVGAPQSLDTGTPLLGFPTYNVANMFVTGLTARF